MKKILLASDGISIPLGAFEFIKQLQLEAPVFLTGLLLHASNYEELLPAMFAMKATPAFEFMEQEKMQLRHAIQQFSELCERNAIEYTMHEESTTWQIEDLSKEARFADLMVMSNELFSTPSYTGEPTGFMQEVIHKAECPVMLFPESFKSFERLIIAYDGKKDSMFAVKEFCNLFPTLTNLETKIVYAKDDDNDTIPQMELLEEFTGRHFTNLDIEKKYADPITYFNVGSNELKNALIICGAFGRSRLSNLIKKSFAENSFTEHSFPLFIAHL